MTEETIESTGGIKIFVRSWLPERPARAVVVLVHGFKSHSGLFERTAAELVQQGFAAYALDLRGHGRSEGERLFAETSATTSRMSRVSSRSRRPVILARRRSSWVTARGVSSAVSTRS